MLEIIRNQRKDVRTSLTGNPVDGEVYDPEMSAEDRIALEDRRGAVNRTNGEVSIRDLDPKFVESRGVKVGDITPYTRMRITE